MANRLPPTPPLRPAPAVSCQALVPRSSVRGSGPRPEYPNASSTASLTLTPSPPTPFHLAPLGHPGLGTSTGRFAGERRGTAADPRAEHQLWRPPHPGIVVPGSIPPPRALTTVGSPRLPPSPSHLHCSPVSSQGLPSSPKTSPRTAIRTTRPTSSIDRPAHHKPYRNPHNTSRRHFATPTTTVDRLSQHPARSSSLSPAKIMPGESPGRKFTYRAALRWGALTATLAPTKEEVEAERQKAMVTVGGLYGGLVCAGMPFSRATPCLQPATGASTVARISELDQSQLDQSLVQKPGGIGRLTVRVRPRPDNGHPRPRHLSTQAHSREEGQFGATALALVRRRPGTLARLPRRREVLQPHGATASRKRSEALGKTNQNKPSHRSRRSAGGEAGWASWWSTCLTWRHCCASTCSSAGSPPRWPRSTPTAPPTARTAATSTRQGLADAPVSRLCVVPRYVIRVPFNSADEG